MFQFIKRNWKVFLVGIIGLTAGFLLNLLANQRSEQRIIDKLLAELKPIKDKLNIGRVTAEEQKRMIQLEAQINLLQS